MVQYYDSPIGLMMISADQRKLRGVSLISERTDEERPNFVTEQAVTQLKEYFSGQRTTFDLFFMYNGTDFQRQVWSKLSEIPYGKLVTYGQLAAAIGQPTACRAVANAVGLNPYLILLPCHRVVGSDNLGGFTPGIEIKKQLLELEGINFSDFKEISPKFLFTFD